MPGADSLPVDFRPLRRRMRRAHGFTLVELIMVLVLTGVLAVFAAPRIFSTTDFYARGFHDESMAMLRYAQKTAIAQRRTVCVAFTSTTASVQIAKNPAIGICDTDLVGPRGEPHGTITAKSGVNYTASPPPAISFDGLGQPLDSVGAVLGVARTITVTGSGKVITIEAATGYVHE